MALGGTKSPQANATKEKRAGTWGRWPHALIARRGRLGANQDLFLCHLRFAHGEDDLSTTEKPIQVPLSVIKQAEENEIKIIIDTSNACLEHEHEENVKAEHPGNENVGRVNIERSPWDSSNDDSGERATTHHTVAPDERMGRSTDTSTASRTVSSTGDTLSSLLIPTIVSSSAHESSTLSGSSACHSTSTTHIDQQSQELHNQCVVGVDGSSTPSNVSKKAACDHDAIPETKINVKVRSFKSSCARSQPSSPLSAPACSSLFTLDFLTPGTASQTRSCPCMTTRMWSSAMPISTATARVSWASPLAQVAHSQPSMEAQPREAVSPPIECRLLSWPCRVPISTPQSFSTTKFNIMWDVASKSEVEPMHADLKPSGCGAQIEKAWVWEGSKYFANPNFPVDAVAHDLPTLQPLSNTQPSVDAPMKIARHAGKIGAVHVESVKQLEQVAELQTQWQDTLGLRDLYEAQQCHAHLRKLYATLIHEQKAC
eukprot:scaffold158828_cov32-Tisochrysis_lutea.AAC.11